jgi:hypothetical protein
VREVKGARNTSESVECFARKLPPALANIDPAIPEGKNDALWILATSNVRRRESDGARCQRVTSYRGSSIAAGDASKGLMLSYPDASVAKVRQRVYLEPPRVEANE